MIYGIGTDLVSIRRIDRVIKRWEDRFIRRVYTPEEIEMCRQRVFPASAFALRFAAKEAFSKAIGLGMTKGVKWRDIEVIHGHGGRPGLRLHGLSSRISKERGITSIHVSLSDEVDYATATVILEKGEK
ncbi:MAG: holo-ACP synthase [Desulfatiglans sp.]|jgi:holo-[acyl-carrier protein] synthase|nr:holo-ACP synthase [Desulfatiglans sp.]